MAFDPVDQGEILLAFASTTLLAAGSIRTPMIKE
jgi:hypothetical protein